MGLAGEVLVIDCVIERGVSGAPVLVEEAEGLRLVAVVSAMGELPGGRRFALTVLSQIWIERLIAKFVSEQ